MKFGNDQIFGAGHFAETSRWIATRRNPASVMFRTIRNIIHANLELFAFIWAKKQS
jgi:hypothetical protein